MDLFPQETEEREREREREIRGKIFPIIPATTTTAKKTTYGIEE